MAALAKVFYDPRSDASAGANNDDFHFDVLLLSTASGVANFENNELSFTTTCGAGSKFRASDAGFSNGGKGNN